MKQTALNTTRPEVSISPQTANTAEITIEVDRGTVRIIAGHDEIVIEAKGTKVRVKP